MKTNIYKTAVRNKLRFETSKGMLSLEQVWNLNLSELDSVALSLEDDHKKSKTKTFIPNVKNVVDKTAKLKLDIIIDIIETKSNEQDKQKEALAKRQHNDRIQDLINKKEDEAMGELSIEDLQSMVK